MDAADPSPGCRSSRPGHDNLHAYGSLAQGQCWFKTPFRVASAAPVMTVIFSTCPITNTLDVFPFVAPTCSLRNFGTPISGKTLLPYADIFLVQIPISFSFLANGKYRYRNVMMLDSKSTLLIK